MTQHDLTTSEGGRAYVAEFFSTRLRRHDFGRYIAERLAADFACALAEYLNEHLAKTEETIRFCPECGCLGDIPAGYQACCPDSSQARVVPKHFAELCAETFQLCISQPYPSDVAAPSNADRATAPSRYTPEYANVIEQLCASLGWHRNKAALLDSDGIFRARTDDAVAIRFASASPTAEQGEPPGEDAYVARRMAETLADVYATIIGDDARQEDESLNPIERVRKAAQVLRLEVDLYRAQREEAAEQAEGALMPAARDVLAERQRQLQLKGWTPEHDDAHDSEEMAIAAACYAESAGGYNHPSTVPSNWPWASKWWKSTTPRRDLVKAGALILAEIERIDRAAASTGDQEVGS